MGDGLRVELADLRGWADQVGRAGGDCDALAAYVATHVPDGDFGRILSLVTGDYEALAHQVRAGLGADGSRLGATRSSLRASAADFRTTDARVAQELGVGARISDDGRAAAFHDVGTTTAAPPATGGEQLPEVSFGWALDRACELIGWLGGPDLRREVTEQVAGDVGKASLQASAWDHAGLALAAVGQNLSHGSGVIGRTWAGAAAASAGAYVHRWETALGGQSAAMAQVADHLRDMVTQAVDVAQIVVDLVREICSIISAGWSMASIPIYGEIRLVEKVKDAIKLANDARKVISVFASFLVMVRDYLGYAVHCFTSESLPPPPAVG